MTVALEDGAQRALPIAAESPNSGVWSPDGTSIAFVAGRESALDVYEYRLADRRVRPLTRDSVAILDWPSWSPDGSRLAVSSKRSGVFDIWTVGLTDAVARQITKTATREGLADWSPDGTQLAFHSYGVPSTQPDIYRLELNATGGRAVALTSSPYYDGQPSWSPDGTRIAFMSNRRGVEEWSIMVMNADGTGTHTIVAGHDFHFTPFWSPDGRRLTFTSRRSGRYHVYVVDADGANLRQVTRVQYSQFVELVRAGRVDEALGAFAAARHVVNDEVYFTEAEITSLAFEALDRGDHEVANCLVVAGLAQYPRSFQIHLAKHALYSTLGRPTPPTERALVDAFLVRDFSAMQALIETARTQFPGWVTFREWKLRRTGERLLDLGAYDEASRVFRLNVLAFPESAAVYFDLGQAYEFAGDLQNAASNYRRSLDIDPSNQTVRSRLDRLR